MRPDLHRPRSDRRPGQPAQWDKCLDHLRQRDTLVITKLDRIGRSMANLIDVVSCSRNEELT